MLWSCAMPPDPLLVLWQQALAFLKAEDWQPAEGMLMLLQQRGCDRLDPLVLADALAFSRLSQGDHRGCLNALLPWLQHPKRTFWFAHKAGDAWRGLGQQSKAMDAYQQALADGSDSPLTYRNLLLVMEQHQSAAIAVVLEHWRTLMGCGDAVWLEGARQAAMLTPDPTVFDWLARQGLEGEQLRPRCVERCLYGLDLDALLRKWDGSAHISSANETALRERLVRLGLLQFAPGGVQQQAAEPLLHDR
jgi:hypothetical protein